MHDAIIIAMMVPPVEEISQPKKILSTRLIAKVLSHAANPATATLLAIAAKANKIVAIVSKIFRI